MSKLLSKWSSKWLSELFFHIFKIHLIWFIWVLIIFFFFFLRFWFRVFRFVVCFIASNRILFNYKWFCFSVKKSRLLLDYWFLLKKNWFVRLLNCRNSTNLWLSWVTTNMIRSDNSFFYLKIDRLWFFYYFNVLVRLWMRFRNKIRFCLRHWFESRLNNLWLGI